MEKNKVTKRDYFNAIRTYAEGVDAIGEYSADEIIAFIDKEIASLDNKAAKAKERAAAKRAETDALGEKVLAALTDEYQTADDITAAVDEEDVTKAKVVSRLSKLIKDGKATKEEVAIEGVKGKKMAYKLA